MSSEQKKRPMPRPLSQLSERSVEEWCEELEKQEKIALDNNQMAMLYKCVVHESKLQTDAELIRLIEGSFSKISMMNSFIKALGQFTITNAALLFMSEISLNPAVIRMYVAYLLYKVHKTGKKHITMDVLSSFIPDGIFSENALYEAWEKQKIIRDNDNGKTSDNMLDYTDYMQSLIK